MARAEFDQATYPPAQFQSRRISEIYGFDTTNGVWRRVAVDPGGALIVSGGGGGVGITDTDDNSIAEGQTTLLAITENYIDDGDEWIRLQGGVDNAVAPGSPQGLFAGGIVTDPVDTFADGDVSLFHFDTSGRLLVSGATGVGITDTDDNSVASGQTTLLSIDENYVFDGTNWIRLQGGVDNAVAPGNPQLAFVGGVVVDPLSVYAFGDVSVLHFDPSGRLLVSGGIGNSDVDDNAVSAGQSTLLTIDENYVFDGTNWVRLQGGVDNAVAPASPQGAFVGGVVTDPVDSFADGDISLFHFDTSGRLLVSGATGVGITDTDDNSVASGQTTLLSIAENYIFDGTNWIRHQGGIDNAVAPATPQGAFVGGVVTDPVDVFADGDVSLFHFDTSGRLLVTGGGVGITDADDNSVAPGQTTLLSIDENYIFNGTNWVRLQGGVDNAVAPASPQGLFAGGVVTDPVDSFADGDISLFHFDTSGRLLVSGATGVGITDTDDNSVAPGQTTLLSIDENYIFNGTNWVRLQGGVDNAVAPASPQGLFAGGVVTDPVDSFADGDISLFHFDTSGRLLVTGGGVGITDTDDNSVASGQTTLLSIAENYIFDGTNWIRHQGGVDNAVAPMSPQGAFVGGIVTDPVDTFVDGDVSLFHFDTSGRLLVSGATGVGITDTDDNSVAPGQTTLLSIDENYIFNGTTWIRQQGGVDNAAAPASPQGLFAGGVVTDPLDAFADGDVSLFHFDTSGRLHTTTVIPASTSSKGTVITAGPNTAVGAGATVALPAIPAGTLAITVQNRTVGGATRVLIRQAGGAAGTGIELLSRGSVTFDNAVAALEAENIAGPAATVAILFERV